MGKKAFDVTLGSRLACQRESLDMTQTEVARQMRADGHLWHQQTVVRVEAGERPLRASEMRSMAAALRISVPDLTVADDDNELREWPRTSRISPAVEVVSDYRGVRWRQISLDRWQSEEGTFIAPFWFLAETWGPLREVVP